MGGGGGCWQTGEATIVLHSVNAYLLFAFSCRHVGVGQLHAMDISKIWQAIYGAWLNPRPTGFLQLDGHVIFA